MFAILATFAHLAISTCKYLRTSAGVRFEDQGDRELKGVSDAVRVWVVRTDTKERSYVSSDGS